jgi:hypothetical protein
MGCGSAREKLENEMIMIKLERIGIQMERQNQMQLLEKIDGKKMKVHKIPDYIDTKNLRKKLSKKSLKMKKRSKSFNLRKKIKSEETNEVDLEGKRITGRKKSKKKSSQF